MENILKGLQGQNFTKKQLFDLLCSINFSGLNETNQIFLANELEKTKEEFKCSACQKQFVNKSSLKRHHTRFKVCKDWIDNPEKNNEIELNKIPTGIHKYIYELMEKAISDNGELECKFCNTKFATKGNHHKHFNTAALCNKLAFQEFKKLINEI
jgi:uncharacterized Zn-finger protein